MVKEGKGICGCRKAFSDAAYRYCSYEDKIHHLKTNNGDELYSSEIDMLVFLSLHSDITMTEIAESMGVTRGAVSQVIKKLVDKGLVIKTTDPQFRSRCILTLTDSGKDILRIQRDIQIDIDKRFIRLFEGMSEKDCRFVMSFMNKVSECFTDQE